MEKDTESKSFQATLDSLSSIREYVTEQASKAGIDKNRIYKLCLAVDEIATNIINYGYRKAGMNNACIRVLVVKNQKQLSVALEDTAPPFNPLERELPNNEELNKPLEERPIGGLGIMLAKDSVDEFRYEYQNNMNRNIFRINI
jgi:anti-sigma regulatory factor (Ser/Thr protein kinase)